MSRRAKLIRVLFAYIAFCLVATTAFWLFGELFFATGYYLKGTWFSFNPALLITGPALGFFFPFGALGLSFAIGVGLLGGSLAATMIALPWLYARWWAYAVSGLGLALWLFQGVIMSGVMY